MSDGAVSTAGQGHPYWYEWFVGLAEVVNLLDPSTEVLSVAFQESGVKGWDDVVVRLKRGRRCLYQVKHTRTGKSLTFGHLVTRDDEGESLLGSLFASWRASGLNDGASRCILYTNRTAGSRAATSEGGVARPPLLTFVKWLSGALPDVASLDDVVPPDEWAPAWAEWVGQLAAGGGEERLAFLRALELRTDQDDLDGLVGRVSHALVTAFGVPEERVGPLLDALHRALRKWTTGHPPVTAEDLYSELALPAEQRALAPAPPPPAPFFPSRVPVAADLDRDLISPDAEPVFFLTAEPGAGKTSVLSWLANRRADRPFTGRVALRFFCFEPLRPESPFIPPDASRVRPGDLWLSLLAQLREGLRGRLRELRVPVRDDLLTWPEARAHVLRLASHLGGELGRPFVIVIDGIDHAARAAQAIPEQVAEFFASLPGPDELRGKGIRLLVAGQPAESYSAHYPTWLASPDPGVRRVELPGLAAGDVRVLYRASRTSIPADQTDEVVRLIEEHAKGNTLSTVFAVAEAARRGLRRRRAVRLRSRRLGDGLSAYYDAIWRHALRQAGELAEAINDSLVASLALARRGVTPDFFAAAFADWGRPAAWWELVLESLGPLLTAGPDGYRVRHNDIRVFLAHRYSAAPPDRRRRVASQLVDYYRRPGCDRVAAHLQLFGLLSLADRSAEWPRVFSVEWVFEAGALGIETDQLLRECEEAVRRLPELGDWAQVVPVACAVQTLERLIEFRESAAPVTPAGEGSLPPFLPSEATVRPLSGWSVADVLALARDAEVLIDAGDLPRAVALLRRWLEGLDLADVVGCVSGVAEDFVASGNNRRLSQDAAAAFEAVGRACARAGWVLPVKGMSGEPGETALFVFERGYVSALVESSGATTLDQFFTVYTPRYVASWAAALRGVATARRWPLVRELLRDLAARRDKLDSRSRAEAAAWALKSGAAKDDQVWVSVTNEPGYGIDPKDDFHGEVDERLAPYLSVAYALGWTRVGLDPRDIAALVYREYDRDDRYEDTRAATLATLRAAAVLGRVEAAVHRGEDADARELLTPAQAEEVLGALWGEVVTGNLRFAHRGAAARLAHSIADVSSELGGAHGSAALARALSFATEFPVDARLPALWAVLRRHGRRDLLGRWLAHWLAPDGAAWRLSRDETRTIVDRLVPLAREAGEAALADQAAGRLDWLQVGYRSHKEYGFSAVLEWFRAAAAASPEVWQIAGWRLWFLCDGCESQGGDNRFEDDIRTAVSAAALRCGVSDWWALVETTFASGFGNNWHDRTRGLLVEGAAAAVAAGGTFAHADLPVIWSLALAFSYWHDETDNRALRTLRDSLRGLPATADQLRALSEALATTTRSASLDIPLTEEHRAQTEVAEEPATRPHSAASVLDGLHRGNHVAPSAAAVAVRELTTGGDSRREDVDAILGAIGAEYAADWSQADRDLPGSMDLLVRSVGDDQLWQVVRAVARGFDREYPYRVYGVYPNLLALALARAKIRGAADIGAGLEVQLSMHVRWAGDGMTPADNPWPLAPLPAADVTWRAAAIRITGQLFRSRSAEVLTAALEGLHALVDADPSVVPEVFAELADEWQRYWLLHAAECWAALHPAAVTPVRPTLLRLLEHGSLSDRLQSWIVLCRHADAADLARPPFPLPSRTSNLLYPPFPARSTLLYTPGVPHGHARLSDRHSAARAALVDLHACGWDFRLLEDEIASVLSGIEPESTESLLSMPHRHNDLFCHNLRTETAVGRAILSVLDAEGCDAEAVPHLAHGYLDNDEPWLQRCPPRRATPGVDWPPGDDYGPSRDLPSETVEQSLRQVAVSLDVPAGWRTFSARVLFPSRERDDVLHFWHESAPLDNYIRPGQPATCPSGRTFLWRMGPFFEPTEPGAAAFVSGFFTCGRRRLTHDHVEIHPPRAWATVLGWQPDRVDPLRWELGGEVVARYDRLHGPLHTMPDSPKHRQPVVDRWIVSEAAFAQVERIYGQLRVRSKFTSHLYPGTRPR